MSARAFWCALACWRVAWGAVGADDLSLPGLTLVQAQPERRPPAQPDQLAAAPAQPPPPLEEGEAPERTNPHMLGDFPGVFILQTFSVPATRTVSTTQTIRQTTFVNVVVQTDKGPITVRVPVTTTVRVPVQQQSVVAEQVAVRVPYPYRGDFKVAENESPRPEDRVFFNYNYYSDATGPGTLFGVPQQTTTATTINGNPARVSTLTPGVAAPRIDIHREVVGFEKTFLGGDASVELRAPVVEQVGAEAVGGSDFGDVTVVLKYAFLNDGAGDVLSAGLAVTVPTGPGVPLPAGGSLHSALLQPWAGYLWTFDRFYVEGFTSLVVPTDARDVTLLCNDVGAGYLLYQAGGGRLVSAVAPTVEAHVTTPLNHRDETSLVTAPDLVVLTAGSHFDLYDRATLSVGVATPLTGPRAFDVEAVVQLNYRF